MDLISVIVPVYNVAPWLRRSVESIMKQTYRNLEIILVKLINILIVFMKKIVIF